MGGSSSASKTGEEEDSVPAATAEEMPAVDESAPVGPSTDEEAAFIANDREAGFGEAPRSAVVAAVGADSDNTPLPPMEDLVKRIPGPARELIEDLFRARFVTVKRMPKTALKSS